MDALRAERLTKVFRVKRKREGFGGSVRALLRPEWEERSAVDGISLTVRAGEALAFLGPNGAGKSTTIKMLTGILHPTSGYAEVLGICPWRERGRLAYEIGTVFGQKSQLWYHLPPADTFELISRMYELERSAYRKRLAQLTERFELGPYLHTPVRKLSLGERMRCEIAASFLHRPGLLFLDEPTIGLDVVVKQRIRELIAELNREEGTTVFLTSHDPGDIERLCRRAVIIHHGSVVLDAPVERMKRDVLTYKTIRLALAEGGVLPNGMAGVTASTDGEGSFSLSVDLTATTIEAVLAQIVASCRIGDVTIEDPPMEEIIKHIYGTAGPAGGQEARA